MTCSEAPLYKMKNTEIGYGGMISTSCQEAAEIGIDILRRGGNAFDAAVAAAFALTVCEPAASGLGGGGFMTAHCVSQNKDMFVDFREVAPAYAVPSIWKIGADGSVVGDEKTIGAKSVCVPGEVAGLCYILEHYGTMSRSQVMQPAIDLARNGYYISSLLAGDIAQHQDDMKRFCEPGNVYVSRKWAEGDLLQNLALADTLEQISSQGEDAFYKGALAERLIKSLNHWGASFVPEDFSSYRVREMEPIRGTYRGYEILSSPPPSSGGTHVVQMLNMLEQFPLKDIPFGSARHLHILSETFKRCFADRAKYMGDPDFVNLPLTGLTSKAYAAERAAEIQLGVSTPVGPGVPLAFEPSSTTHLSVTDKDGNLVALTQTISAFFGSAIVPEGTGIVLNCQMRGFSIGEGKSNSVAPGKKPLSSMSPTIVMKDGAPYAVLGSPGANRIISGVVQVISALIDYQMPLAEAVSAPRIYNDTNNIFQYEPRFDPDVIAAIEAMGQKCQSVMPLDRYMGGINAICMEKNGLMFGAADPRRNGIALSCTCKTPS